MRRDCGLVAATPAAAVVKGMGVFGCRGSLESRRSKGAFLGGRERLNDS